MTRRAILALILIGYFVLAGLFAIKTPAWQAPDEPAHYNYVAYLAQNGTFPVLHFGDYPGDYLEKIKTAKFAPDLPIHPIRYEFHQPPLYYLIASPVYSLSGGSLTALRLLSVLMGAGIALLAYGIGRAAAPREPAIALGAAAIVAFLPQHLATVSQVGNDVLAELLVAAVLYALARGALSAPRSARDIRFPLLIGVLLGLVLITKTTAYIVIPAAGVGLVWRWVRQKTSAGRIVVEATAVILPAAGMTM
jgi:4-amino-4-deoxy-L-arabinose transferase-like glycosyltransferase